MVLKLDDLRTNHGYQNIFTTLKDNNNIFIYVYYYICIKIEEIGNTIHNHRIKTCLVWSYATAKTDDKSSWLMVVIVTRRTFRQMSVQKEQSEKVTFRTSNGRICHCKESFKKL